MSTNLGLLEPSPPSSQPTRYPFPAKVIVILAVSIFLAEMFSMTVLYFVHLPNYLLVSLMDGIIMLALILPGLYFLQFKPILQQMENRSRAEQALRASEALLARVLQLLPVGVWIIDRNGKIVHGNPASQEIWAGARYVGIDQYEEYKAWWVDTGQRVAPEEWAGTRAITRGATVLNDEVEIESFAGDRKIILNSALPILTSENAIQGAIVVNQDITRLRQGEKALKQTNELLEKFFLSISTLIAYMDRDFNFLRVNQTYARAGGHPAEFFPGKNHFDLYPNEENLAIFRQVVETGEPFSAYERPFEYAEFPERGVSYWDWSLQPVLGADGEVEGVVLSLVDVTERKRAQIQLASQNEELRALSQAEHRQRELAEGLVQATIAVNTSLELDQVLRSILEQIRKAIPSQGASIILLEEEDIIRLAGCLGFERFPDTIRALGEIHRLEDYPPIAEISASLQPVFINSGQEHQPWRLPPGLEWANSYISVPLMVADKLTGIIDLNSELANAFTQEDVDRLMAFAAPAALAIHNAQLYKAESLARRAAETLSTAALALTQKLDFEHVIHTLLDHLQLIVQSDTAGITLLEDETRLSVRAVRGYGRWAEREDIPVFPMEGITDSVIQRLILSRRSLTIPNIAASSNLEDQPDNEHIRNWLIVPIIADEKVIGLVEMGKAGTGLFSQEHTIWAEALVSQAAVAIQNAWLFEQVRSSSERLQSLTRRLVEVQENERHHIARELHDEAGQVLSSLKLKLIRLDHDPDCPQHVRQRLLELEGMADGVLEDLHRLAMDLRPASLDHLGLVAALEQLAGNLRSEQIAVQFKALGFTGERISPTLETTLYRIVQEALTNVVRYAQASNVGILLERGMGKVRVFVEDDGVGFDPELVERGYRLGLVGMRERAEMLAGSLTIESTPGLGTSVIVEVPDGDSHPDRG